jgi:putative membrane-bound dehydrogenase-like protein
MIRWVMPVFALQASMLLAGEPVCADPRLAVELVAREPEIVTPTGIAVDEAGRIWIIENNTHQRQPEYKGYSSDRIRIFSDFDKAGHPRKVQTFAEGFKNSMGLALGRAGAVYLATRSAIYLWHDTRLDGTAGEKNVIVKLDTPGDYPHNGLSGFAFDALGNVFFGLGENLGAAYKLIGSDGTTCSGGGEGGSVYRCRPDGSKLTRVATGFWNPFHLAFDTYGRLFAVDNDPDSRGPCRLLHVVYGGDYGYRFRNGRKGLHPFTAWNGELPGTLPMVAGTAEAPAGIVCYESGGLPPDYRGALISTSWGDHVIELFRPEPRGASFTARSKILVRGDENFRPVGIAIGPDGNLVVSDWVDKSYPVHGKGRIWRIRMNSPPPADGPHGLKQMTLDRATLGKLLADPPKEIREPAWSALDTNGQLAILRKAIEDQTAVPRARIQALWFAASWHSAESVGLLTLGLKDPAPELRAEAARLLGEISNPASAVQREASLLDLVEHDPSSQVRLQALLQLRERNSLGKIVRLLMDKDPYIAGAALTVLGRPGNTALLLPYVSDPQAEMRLGTLLALRRIGDSQSLDAVPKFLDDDDPGVRRAAIQWVAEDHLVRYEGLIEGSASRQPVTRDLFEALLAARDILAGAKHKPTDESSGQDYIARILSDPRQPAAFRALALRMLQPDHPSLRCASLRRFLMDHDPGMRHEAMRSLVLRTDDETQAFLREVASDRGRDWLERAEAVAGLAHSAPSSAATRQLLTELLRTPRLQRDALRSLRECTKDGRLALELLDWWKHSGKNGFPKSEAGQERAAQLAFVCRTTDDRVSAPGLEEVIATAGGRPKNESEWNQALAGTGEEAAGERLFYHPRGPRCYQCHRVDGRGGAIGPDLSSVGRSLSREKMIESILTPSKEIAPQFVAWMVATRDGKVRTGVIVDEGPNSTITLGDAQGRLEVINRLDVEDRHALPKSIMPDNLAELMTVQEFRDLLTFLQERK